VEKHREKKRANADSAQASVDGWSDTK